MTRFRNQKHGKKTRGIWQASRLEGKVKNAGINKVMKPRMRKPTV